MPDIHAYSRVVPMIYAYSTPGIDYHEGWTKIGYTEKQSVKDRIDQQTHTAGIKWSLEWQDNALYKDGSGLTFTDHDFHDYLEAEHFEREKGTEWFRISGDESQKQFNIFSRRATIIPEGGCTYILRNEQQRAVDMTRAYFENGGKEFLWNAKPRFGKTLTSYDLIQAMGFKDVLIVTNRPSIANSWADDFRKFVGWKGKYYFVSDTDALSGKPGVLTRQGYINLMTAQENDTWAPMIAFESLQGLKGSVYFGGEFDKLQWIADNDFDLLIVDESQEGVDTHRTERAFDNIRRRHTLYLSGTPFKQLASDQFTAEQIFNWSYADEQAAKADWKGPETNPYQNLPRMALYTYQLSNMIYDTVKKGLDLSGEDGKIDYAFDLNEFFATSDSGKFIHEDEIKKFLHALSTQEKYPYSTPELRKELSHTLWILNRVASCKALMKLLKDDAVFKDYEIVLAAGDGRTDDDDKQNTAALDRVRTAIKAHDKTITLSVGQLTVGVTVPEWSGVMMLCNLSSPSSYMQAAFRAQNPCLMTVNGESFRKETAYVFDFDPARTLTIFDDFANNLRPETAGGGGSAEEHRKNIRILLNFFPVLGEDDNGRMTELDAAQVLSIPRKLKSVEVVRHGFMSNFLFANISNVFGAPALVKEIVDKMGTAHEEKQNNKKHDPIEDIGDVNVDENGDVQVPDDIVIGQAQNLFGEKVYAEIKTGVSDTLDVVNDIQPKEPEDKVKAKIDDLAKQLSTQVADNILHPAAEDYGIRKSAENRIARQVDNEIKRKFDDLYEDYHQQTNIVKTEYEKQKEAAVTHEQKQKADEEFNRKIDEATKTLIDAVKETTEKTIQEKPQEMVKQLETEKARSEKESIEDSVRAHLRGFARTIPSFIMAYGDGKLTLANFDDYTEDDVFLEVTGITEDDFRFLRDGGTYTDPETGEEKEFAGHLFDETVFNDSITEFWNMKQELANYFDESHDEDIFDYIPPQKTNQIYTPKWVVKKMVDELEEENPGCFDDPYKTFADLYMKSGLYITEIVKRLFRSEDMKAFYPDDNERIRHILSKQVYGMAPTRIIYLIAINYIFGFDPSLEKENSHFVQCDAAEASKNGTLAQMVDKYFG